MSTGNIFIVFCCVALIPAVVIAQTPNGQVPPATTFRLMAEIGGGYVYKTSAAKQNLGTYTRGGIAGTVRLRWGSSNLLGVGIETGWFPISSTSHPSLPTEFGNLNVDASLTAIPVLFIISIQRLGMQFHSGIGYYQVNSVATVGSSTIESVEWDLGFLVSLGVARPLTDGHSIGAEIKWYNITEQQISAATIQVRYIYRLFEL
jgi:hypothetical protein